MINRIPSSYFELGREYRDAGLDLRQAYPLDGPMEDAAE